MLTISWPSFIIGLLIGFVLGAGFVKLFHKTGFQGDQFLAWSIAISWLLWHLSSGVGVIDTVPPTMYDVVSGGAVGFILGEKFFDYITGSIGKVFGGK